MAATPDLEVIKDIPGYKVILKAVLKSQIQQLVEQLASTTDEESVILTASVSDGTLSHLGSDSGKFFLDDHEDIKSQFLGFCLKRHHKKKQEKERQEALRNLPTTPSRYVGPGGPRPAMIRSPRFSSPRQPHPVALTRAPLGTGIRSPGMRHSPYPMTRPPRRTSLNFEQQSPPNSSPNAAPMKLPLGNNQVIKIEPDEEDSNHSAGDSSAPVQSDDINTGAPNISSQTSSSSPSQTLECSSVVKSEAPGTEGDRTDIPNTDANDAVPPEGLSLDSDLSNLIASETSQDSGNNSQPRTPQSSASASETSNTEVDPNINVKVESISESEMELEITGVEPGRPMNPGGSQDNWGSGQMGYDPTGATGSQADMQAGDPGYNLMQFGITADSSSEGMGVPMASTSTFYSAGSELRDFANISESGTSKGKPVTVARVQVYICPFCQYKFPSNSKLNRHMRIHTGEKPFHCEMCDYKCARKDYLKIHIINMHKM